MRASTIGAELEKLGEAIARGGSIHPVLGNPIALGTRTIVPVSAIIIAFGAGGGGFPLLSGSGGGGEVRVIPIGFLCERDGELAFTAIELPEGLLKHGKKPAGWRERLFRGAT